MLLGLQEPIITIEKGIPYLTVYAFSTENWKRSEDEVSYLMALMKRYLSKNKSDALRKGVRIRVIGDKSRLSPDLQELLASCEEDTKTMDKLNLTFAINYGGRDEIVRAVKKIAADGRMEEEITEDLFSSYLDTRDIPDPDLLIRTSGEERLSNFLLWQLAYAEFYFTDTLWPDFNMNELLKAIEVYTHRDRRYGKLKG